MEKEPTATELLSELADEKEYLERRGYSFPSLFAAVELLLKRAVASDPQ